MPQKLKTTRLQNTTVSLRQSQPRKHSLLQILNILSLIAGFVLLIAVSWEILLGNPRHYSSGYLLLQSVVCVVFLADFFAQMWVSPPP